MGADTLFTPVLERTIQKLARDVVRRMAMSDPAQAQKDIEQELRKVVLECALRHRGKNGAQLATYAFLAIRLAAWRLGGTLESPVHVAKNKLRSVWGRQTGVVAQPMARSQSQDRAHHQAADPMDWLPNPHSLETELEDRDIAARIESVIRQQKEPHAVARVLLHGEPAQTVAAELKLPVGTLRKCVQHARQALQSDPALRSLLQEHTPQAIGA